MSEPVRIDYDPREYRRVSFSAARADFLDGSDTPRAFLERCIETIEAREPAVRAFVVTNLPGARAAADESTQRYRSGRPASIVDGLPVGIKDLYETEDMPTQMGSAIFEGWESKQDCAHVYALRRGGALIVGKTVTTEFGQARPGPTRNPFDTGRTPGGSSSGSAAAVGAGMVPVATGSQVRGSIVRPAGYCANYALKPTYGALNRRGGHGFSPSQSVLGAHAATPEDCWSTAYYISSTAGGDPGFPGLFGEPVLEDTQRIERLVRLDTLGWKNTDPEIKELFEDFLRRLEKQGIRIVSRKDDPRVEALEQALETIPDFMFDLFSFESRWPVGPLRDRAQHLLPKKTLERLEVGEHMTIHDYRDRLDMRERLRQAYAAAGDLGDAFISLVAQDLPPEGMGTGDAVYGDISSCLGCPAASLPFLAHRGLPVGIQLMNAPHGDYALMRMSKWLRGELGL